MHKRRRISSLRPSAGRRRTTPTTNTAVPPPPFTIHTHTHIYLYVRSLAIYSAAPRLLLDCHYKGVLIREVLMFVFNARILILSAHRSSSSAGGGPQNPLATTPARHSLTLTHIYIHRNLELSGVLL